MEGLKFIQQLVIIFGFSIPVIYLFNKIKLPSIIGFLITGIIIGPFGLKLIDDMAGIHFLAELGVAFLLFTIGIDIQLSRFIKNLSNIFLTGGLQVLCTFLIGAGIGCALQLNIGQSVFIGFILVHSSSALILKMLKDRGDEDSLQGRFSVGVILFQDLMVVPMMLFIPFLAGDISADAMMILWKLVKSILIVAVIMAAGRYVIPFVMERLVGMNMREMQVIASVVITMGIAWITESMGLSLAIGAFLAGLALSDTDFTYQIISDVNPFRDVSLSVFFVSFGMILNVDFLLAHTGYILFTSAMIIVVKAVIVFGLVKALGQSLRVAVLSGVLLSQIGEFSFVLASQGFTHSLISSYLYQTFIAAAVLTFIATPLLISLVCYVLTRRSDHVSLREGNGDSCENVFNHVIICGMGLNGRNLVKVLKNTAIDYVVIDLNYWKIKKSKRRGDAHRIWGDASSMEIIQRANVKAARVMVIAISDRYVTKICLARAKAVNPGLHVIVRTRYVEDIEGLLALGANDVIPEEFETSIQIFSRVLRLFHIPNSIILAEGNIIRNRSYGVFRDVRFTPEAFDQINQILAQGTIETWFVGSNNMNIGKSIRDIDLKARSGALIINIIRDNQTITNPPSDFVLQAADQLVLFGSHIAIDKAMNILEIKEEKKIE